MGASIADADGASVPEGIAITAASVTGAGTGTWQFSVDGGTTWTAFSTAVPTLATTTALVLRDVDRVRFVPDAANGATATITYKAWDQTSGDIAGKSANSTVGTAFSTASDIATLTVTPVNDAPGLSGNLILPAIAEDTAAPTGGTIAQLLTGSGVTLQDVDTGSSLSGLAIVGNAANASIQGAWQYSTDGTNWFSVGTVGDNNTTQALALSTTARLRFVPVADYFGTRHATSNYGVLYTAKGVASIIGGWFGALLYEQFGSWSVGFYGSAVMALVAAVLAMGLRASRVPRQAVTGVPVTSVK